MLTIEPMDEEDASNRTQRLKRLAFYENNGYQSLNHFYFEGTERYQILITDRSLSLDKIEQDLAKTFLGKHGVRAVSYTHLDVYKRQGSPIAYL